MQKFNPRRPYDDDKPDWYLESDMCFIKNNIDLVTDFLNMLDRMDENQRKEFLEGIYDVET